MSSEPENRPHNDTPLQGWKEIASFLDRDESTARRWEREESLPIRRHRTDRRSSVYAYPSELEAWRASRPAQLAVNEAPNPSKPRLWIWAAAAAVAAVILSTLILNPPNPLVDAAGRANSMVARQVWAGEGVDDRGEISPDGRFLAYIDWVHGSLMLRDVESGTARLLYDAHDYKDGYVFLARFSPDGKQIAFMWDNYSDPKQSFQEIRLVSLGPGGQPGELRALKVQARAEQWSRDGKNLLVTEWVNGQTRIGLVSVKTGELQPIKTVGWDIPNPLLSPDGRFVAYDLPHEPGAENRDIHLVATDGSFETTLVEHPAHEALIAWDPNGSRVFFVSDRNGELDLYSLPVSDGRPSGSPVALRQGVGAIRGLGVTSDGRLFYSSPVGASRISFAQLPRLHDAGYSPEPLASSVLGEQSQPAFSPDGRLLVYLTRSPRMSVLGESPPVKMIIRYLESGAERELDLGANGLRVNELPPSAFSPDSRSILVAGYSSERRRRSIATIDVETGAATIVRSIEENEYISPAGWLDEGTVLVRSQTPREENGKSEVRSVVMRLDIQTGQTHDIFMRGRLQGVGALSPDRHYIVFLEWHSGGQQHPPQLTVIPTDGSQPRTLLSLPAGHPNLLPQSFSPDGRFVYFGRLDPDKQVELWRTPFEGGEAEPAGLTFEDNRVLRFAMHPDGRRMAFQSGQARTEIWALENFLNEQ